MIMLDQAHALHSQLIEWRRDFHQHPELGFAESRTAGKAAEILENLGYRVRRNVGRTGVVAERGSGGPTIAIRADMDALPLQEANPVSYASQIPGVMHACGHDAHVAMALGAATLLAREAFPGTVRFLLQPSEEAGDAEGISGAPRMVQEGAMDNVDLVLALHVDASTPVGRIRISAGPSSGGVDSFFGRVSGKGGHGARPQDTIDPFYLTAHVIFALNAVVSRRLGPFDPAVVSLGMVHGGHTQNVIPAYVELSGTLRYTDPRVQTQIHAEIQRAFTVARALGGDYDLRFEFGSLPMINHPRAVDLIRSVAGEMLGEAKVLPIEKDLGAEDFGSFMALAPGAMFMLGVQREGDVRFAHNPTFDIDETALPLGAAILAQAVLRFVQENRK
jgi:amidohydrolase